MHSQSTNSNKSRELFVGIEGGGTKTSAVVATSQGEILGSARGGPSRLELVGEEQAGLQIKRILNDVLRKSNGKLNNVRGLCIGFGGLDTQEDLATAKKIGQEAVPQSTEVVIEDDAMVGLYSGTFGRPGIGIVAGTGSLLVGVNDKGQRDRVDGWGHFFGDLGSAYYLGREAIKSSLEDYDGRGKETALRKMIVEKLGLDEIPDVLNYFHDREDSVTRIAKVSPLVDRAAQKGDEVAHFLIQSAAKELCRSTYTLVDKLDMTNSQKIRLVLIGGVFNSSHLTLSYKNYIYKDYSNVCFIRPQWEPAVGAIILALEKSGREINQKMRQNIREGFKKNKEV